MRRTISIFTLILMTVMGLHAQVAFKVIPPRNVVAGDRFQVIYQLDNAEGTSPKIPSIDGCELLFGPAVGRQSSTSIVNGNVSTRNSVSYTYTYKAGNAGTFTIPAASITAEGKTYSTQATTFKVLPPDSRQQPSQQGGGGYGGGGMSAPDVRPTKQIGRDDIFVRIIPNKTTAYEQEAISCTVKLYTAYNSVVNFSRNQPPKFDDFLIEEIEPGLTLNELEHYNGRNYYVADIKKCIIFPQKTGRLTITSGTYDITVQQLEQVSNGFFIRSYPVETQVSIPASSATINVKPLPQPQPAGFDGAVGNFTVSSALAADQLRTGEATSYTLNIKGSGNIKFLHEPQIDFPAEFEQYPAKEDIDSHISGNTVTGTMSIEYTFVPQSPGRFNIPAVEFVYFNPADNSYHTATTDSYHLDVAKGAGSSTATIDRQDIKVKNTDIIHIHTGNHSLSHTRSFLADSVIYWLLYPLLLLLFIAGTVVTVRRIRANADITGRKVSKAGKVARKRLAQARAMMKSQHKEQFYDAILKAMWGYLSDKLAIPVSSLTRANIADELAAYGTPADITSSLINLLDECEMARYTPDGTNASMQQIYDSASEIMNQLQNVKKSK